MRTRPSRYTDHSVHRTAIRARRGRVQVRLPRTFSGRNLSNGADRRVHAFDADPLSGQKKKKPPRRKNERGTIYARGFEFL